MMGDEAPFPGMGVLQVIFLSLDHSTGRFFSALTPSPSGPRQQGQSAARETEGRIVKMTMKSRRISILVDLRLSEDRAAVNNGGESLTQFRIFALVSAIWDAQNRGDESEKG